MLESLQYFPIGELQRWGAFWGSPSHFGVTEGLDSDEALKPDMPCLMVQSIQHTKQSKQNLGAKTDFWYVNAVSIVISIISLLGGKTLQIKYS